MPTMFQELFEELTKELGNLKTDEDKDQVIIDGLLQIIHCSIYDIYNNDIDLDFLNKVEDIKQYRQPEMTSENIDFFLSVIKKVQRFKIMTMVIVYEINPKLR